MINSFLKFHEIFYEYFYIYLQVRFAHITFAGNRADFEVDVNDIYFASETNQKFDNIYWTIKFISPVQRSLHISTKYGGIEDPEKFKLIFGDVPKPKVK